MTLQRRDSHSTEFGLWLRKQKEIDSGLGFVATNLDYIWRNYRTGNWMLIEEKRYMSNISFAQGQCFLIIDRACRNESKYKGFHKIVFEKTSPDDGRTWLDDKEVTKRDILDFLEFDERFFV